MSNVQAIKAAGVVVSAGKMMKTVTVRIVKQEWNRQLRKYFPKHTNLLVNDPTSAVVTGDVVTLAPERHSKRVSHTVSAIVAPFGKPLAERPALLTAEERERIREVKAQGKAERRLKVGKGPLARALAREAKEARAARAVGRTRSGEVREEVDDGEVMMQHGREVLPGGLHKFGKINEEALRDAAKTARKEDVMKANLKELNKVRERPPEEVARSALQEQTR